jgi:hypothetical protein
MNHQGRLAVGFLHDISLDVPHDHVFGIDAEFLGPVRPAEGGQADVLASGVEVHRLLAEDTGLALRAQNGPPIVMCAVIPVTAD